MASGRWGDDESAPRPGGRRTQPDGSGKKTGASDTCKVDGRGVPLSLVVTAANRHDVTELATLLEGRVVAPVADDAGVRPRENLCADAGYAGKPADDTIHAAGFIPHVRSRNQEKVDRAQHPDYRPRRWVVEVSHSWFTRFRKLLVRYEKTLLSCLALHQLAAAIIAFRRHTYLYGPY